jgi:hypothetical protein
MSETLYAQIFHVLNPNLQGTISKHATQPFELLELLPLISLLGGVCRFIEATDCPTSDWVSKRCYVAVRLRLKTRLLW